MAEDERTRPRGVQKSYVTILEQEIEEALDELERPSPGLFMSGLSAGLDIGFSVFLITVIITSAEGVIPDPFYELLRASAYSVGFILVIFGRSELFTEHTTLAMLPVLGGAASMTQLVRLWGIVYVSNLIGGVIFASMLATVGPALGTVEPAAIGELAIEVIDHPGWVIFVSAVLAGWLMGLLSWLVTAGRDTISEIVFVWLVTGTIGLAHFHHCILGSVEVLAGIFAGQGVTFSDFGRFLFYATLGNLIGGVFFVALIKYGHATIVRRGMRHPVDIREAREDRKKR